MKKQAFQVKTKPAFVIRLFLGLWQVIIGLVIMGITLGICFAGLELYFRHYYKNDSNTPQTVMNLPIYQESSYRSWDHKPNTVTYFGKGDPTPEIRINSIGLRNPEVSPIKERKRYLMLGDSFAFGMGVSEEDAFPARLQKYLGTKFHNVINAGVIGQTIDDEFMYLMHEGIKLQPDFVIYNFFVGNDITELRRHEWEKNNTGELIRVKDTVLHVNEKNQLRFRESKEPDYYFLFWLEQKIQIFKQKYIPSTDVVDPTLTWPVFVSDINPGHDAKIDEYWLEFEEVLKQMNEFCKANHTQLIVNIIPMDVQVSKSYWKKYPNMPFDQEAFDAKRPQKRVKLLAQKYNIPTLDLLPWLQENEKENNEPLYFPDDPHFNVLGHRMAASYIWKFLMDNFL